jgi:1,2-diacylglycerol 3-alpha-glucosyltransferase
MKSKRPEKLRICFVSQRLPKTGLGADYGYLWPLCRNLVRRGHEITVITMESHEGAASQFVEGVHIHYVESPLSPEFGPGLKESILDRLEELHIEKPFHLIHGVDHTSSYIAQHKAKLQTALAVDVKGTQLDRIFGILGMTEETLSSYISTSMAVGFKFLRSFFGDDRRMLKHADGVFVASLQQQDILERYYYVPSRKVHIIPFGIDGRQFEPAPPDESLLRELGIDRETKIILTITPLINLDETKNLLSAFERVVIKKPKTALIIVGEGPKRKELEFHMLNLALGSKVWFAGQVEPDKLHSLINTCDIYCNLYSRSSGFEPTVLEAMASCKTVIASEVGTSSNVIENGVDGFLIRPTEIHSLSRLILEAVSDQVDTKTVGAKARQKILKMFDTAQMVDQTIQAYQEILLATGKYKK